MSTGEHYCKECGLARGSHTLNCPTRIFERLEENVLAFKGEPIEVEADLLEMISERNELIVLLEDRIEKQNKVVEAAKELFIDEVWCDPINCWLESYGKELKKLQQTLKDLIK